jgi:hypothetical protein
VETTDGENSDSEDFQDSFQILPNPLKDMGGNLDPSNVLDLQSHPPTEGHRVTFRVPTEDVSASRREVAAGRNPQG